MSKAMLVNGEIKKVKVYSLIATTNEKALRKCGPKQVITKKVDDSLVLIDSDTLESIWQTSHIESLEKVPAGFGQVVVIIKTTNSTYVLHERG